MGSKRHRKKTSGSRPPSKWLKKLKTAALIGLPVIGAAIGLKAVNWYRYHKDNKEIAKEVKPESDTNNELNSRAPEGIRVSKKGDNLFVYFRDQEKDKVVFESETQSKDPAFGSFKHLFSGPSISFDKACRIIRKATGKDIKRYKFVVPDRYNLTRTKRFYAMYIVPLYLPKEDGGFEPVKTGSNHVFDTFAKNPSDGRIQALAAYILSKNNCDPDKPEEAIKTIAWWVMNNIEVDAKNMTIPGLEHKKKDIEDLLKKAGFGITHNHPNSLRTVNSTAVCVDYTNLCADLLNSVGIPARTASVFAKGMHRDLSNRSIQAIFHSTLQVALPSGNQYYDVMPKGDGSGRITSVRLVNIGSPREYIVNRFKRRYPRLRLFRVGSFASLPVERLGPFPEMKKALDQGMKGVSVVNDEILFNKEKIHIYTSFWSAVEPEIRIYFNDTIMNSLGAIRR